MVFVAQNKVRNQKLLQRLVKIGIALFYINLFVGHQVFAETTANLFVPNDVLTLFNGATKKEKLKYCKTGKLPYEKLQKLSVNPPKRILGYNSRMDNVKQVEGGSQLNEMVNLFSNVYMDQLVKQNEALQSIAFDCLYKWANASALLDTKSCVKQDGIDAQDCTSWKQSDGQDPSDYMDYHTAQIGVMHLAYGYYFTLVSFKPDDPKHLVIKEWFNQFLKRNRRPQKVQFGLDLGYYWPKIFSLLITNNQDASSEEVRSILENLLLEVDKLLLEDGAIKDRTTRGNRGLWYHHSSLAELIITIEMARRFDIPISEQLNKRIEKAGEIFLNAFEDHSYLDNWAKVAYRGIYTPGKQEFPETIDLPNGNSWFYIYIYRYPNSEVSRRLQKLLDEKPRTSRRDGLVGFGLGCVYAVANQAR